MSSPLREQKDTEHGWITHWNPSRQHPEPHLRADRLHPSHIGGDLALGRLKEREAAIRRDFEAGLESVRLLVGKLEENQGELTYDVREGVSRLQVAFESLSAVVLQHVQSEASADSRRDATLAEHSGDLARLASAAGSASGARSGGLVAVVVTAAIAAILDWWSKR